MDDFLHEEDKFRPLVDTLDRIRDLACADLREFTEWNTIPYGVPDKCKPQLLVIVDGKVDITEVLQEGVTHLERHCTGITIQVLIYVTVPLVKWRRPWFEIESRYTQAEERGVSLDIRFKKR